MKSFSPIIPLTFFIISIVLYFLISLSFKFIWKSICDNQFVLILFILVKIWTCVEDLRPNFSFHILYYLHVIYIYIARRKFNYVYQTSLYRFFKESSSVTANVQVISINFFNNTLSPKQSTFRRTCDKTDENVREESFPSSNKFPRQIFAFNYLFKTLSRGRFVPPVVEQTKIRESNRKEFRSTSAGSWGKLREIDSKVVPVRRFALKNE